MSAFLMFKGFSLTRLFEENLGQAATCPSCPQISKDPGFKHSLEVAR